MARQFSLDDAARLVHVLEPCLSPDGRRVAVVLETVDETANVLRRRLVVFEVSRPGRRRTIATGEGKLGSPRWSPDGTRLAYLTSRRSRDGKAQLEVRSVASGRSPGPLRLTSAPTGVSAPAWSPDGEWLAFVASGADRAGDDVPAVETDPKRRFVRIRGHRHRMEGAGYVGVGDPRAHVWIVPAGVGSGDARQVTDGPSDDGEPAWSPDGRSIAFISDRSADRDRHFGGDAVHVVKVRTGAVRRLSPEGMTASLPAWSPDGRSIAYLRSDSPNRLDGHHNRLWVVNVRTGDEACWSAGVDRSVGIRPGGYTTPSRPAWAADSSAIVQILAEAGAAQLARFTPDGLERLTGDDAVIEEIAPDRTGERAVLLRTDAVTPSELWFLEPGSAPRRLAGFNDDLLAAAPPRRPSRRTVTRPDGLRIDGWLTVPAGRKARPLVVSVHGGPHNAFGERFGEDLQLLVAAGYAVLQVNPRGSGSYEESFARAVVGDWGGADFEDILAVLDDALSDRSLRLDPRRVAITGGSYGGFMACWAITQTDRFAVAVAGAPIVNFESEYGTADIGPTWFEREQLGTPWADRERYAARSAIRFVDRVRTPLLLYHGEADLRCPIEQSEQFFSALVALGREVELVRVPSEGHVLPSDASPVHRRLTREVILEWFGRYLKPGA